MNRKVIITCAVTGSIHTPTMSPHLPITPEEITRQSVDAAKAGASILHLHARNPETGQPTADPEVFMQEEGKERKLASCHIAADHTRRIHHHACCSLDQLHRRIPLL